MRRIYGIDFKNPFTMSNTGGGPPNFRLRGTVSLHPWIIVERIARRAPVSRSKAAPYGALCSAGRSWKSVQQLSLLYLSSCDLVEPIGIEPMT